MLLTNIELKKALKMVSSSRNKLCRFIGLAVPLFGLTEEPGRLSLEIEKLESTFQCDVETTSDILSILR